MIHSVSGLLKEGGISRSPPFYAPHHMASKVALVGGGRKAQPGEISLAHNDVLFWMNCPNSHAKRLKPCASRLKRGKFGLPAPAHIFAIRAGFY